MVYQYVIVDRLSRISPFHRRSAADDADRLICTLPFTVIRARLHA